MSEAVTDLLLRIEDAIAEGDYRRASNRLESLLTRYDERRPEERRRIERAKALRRKRTTDASVDDPVDRFLEAVTATTVTRFAVSTEIGVGVPAGRIDELDEALSSLRERERILADRADAVADVLRDTSLEELPRLYTLTEPDRPVHPGETFSVTATVGNAGDTAATDVRIGIDGPPDSGFADRSRTVHLGPRETRDVEFELTATEPGTHPVAVAITHADRTHERETEIEVLEARDLIDRADATISLLEDRIEQSRTGRVATRRLLSTADVTRTQLERGAAALASGRRAKAENRLTTSINQLGTLLNKLHATENRRSGRAGRGKGRKGRAEGERPNGNAGITPLERQSYGEVAEIAIEYIVTARDQVRAQSGQSQ